MRFTKETAPFTAAIIGAAIEVHAELGTGLLEHAYQEAMAMALDDVGISHAREVAIPIFFKGRLLPTRYRADFVAGDLIIELKATAGLTRNDEAQVIHYLKCSRRPLALLINFGTYPIEVRRFAGPDNIAKVSVDS